MTLLVAYATTDGQTGKIARYCADHLSARHSVELLNLQDAEGLDLGRFVAVLLAGSVHMHGFQTALIRFARAHAADLSRKPSLFLAVSLSAAGQDAEDWQGLREIHAAFQSETGWTPGTVLDVAGAFRFSQYDVFRAWAMRRIARQKDATVDPKVDTEYTDWPALALALDVWAATVPARAGD